MQKPFSPLITWLGIGLALAGIAALLIATPGGLLRKADYIGAAVCHRRASHSFFIDGEQLPLCERCSGTFPGALTGLLVQWGFWRRRRSLSFPRWTFFIPVFLFAGFWALDGINSTTSDGQFNTVMQQFISRPAGVGILGYAPQPWIRLLSGALMGLSMSVVLVPAFNQSLWYDGEETRTLRTWHEMGLLVAVELAMAGAIYLLASVPSALALYTVSIYSALGVLAMFTLLGAMMFTLITHRDATVSGWRHAWPLMVWGVVFAVLVVAMMDSMRLLMVGTIDGIPGLD